MAGRVVALLVWWWTFWWPLCCSLFQWVRAALCSLTIFPPPALKPHDNQCNYHISTSPSLLVFPSHSVSLFISQFVVSSSSRLCFQYTNLTFSEDVLRSRKFSLIPLCFKTALPHGSACCNIDLEIFFSFYEINILTKNYISPDVVKNHTFP